MYVENEYRNEASKKLRYGLYSDSSAPRPASRRKSRCLARLIEELQRHGIALAGSLYPLLHGWRNAATCIRNTMRGRAKEYRATPAGKKALEQPSKIRELFEAGRGGRLIDARYFIARPYSPSLRRHEPGANT